MSGAPDLGREATTIETYTCEPVRCIGAGESCTQRIHDSHPPSPIPWWRPGFFCERSSLSLGYLETLVW